MNVTAASTLPSKVGKMTKEDEDIVKEALIKKQTEERRAIFDAKMAQKKADELQLFANMKEQMPQLKELLVKVDDHWASEDLVYRFYHHSFKVFYLQEYTVKIVEALKNLCPAREINKIFLRIFSEGTGKEFDREMTNSNWLGDTRPIVEAFFHARYFLQMAVKYGQELDGPVNMLPSGWAGFLYFYNLR